MGVMGLYRRTQVREHEEREAWSRRLRGSRGARYDIRP